MCVCEGGEEMCLPFVVNFTWAVKTKQANEKKKTPSN